MKTLRQYLEELPEPYRTEALNNADRYLLDEEWVPSSSEVTHNTPLSHSFIWQGTPQGHEYWEEANNKFYNSNP